MCAEHPNRMLANGPNHPGPGPEEIPMVDVSLPASHFLYADTSFGYSNDLVIEGMIKHTSKQIALESI